MSKAQSYQADSHMEPEVPWRINQGLNPQDRGLDLQGQGQGLKICPEGHLKAKDNNTGSICVV